jgi:lipopolysaccharide export LptBFGC system permease protein LptF
MRLISRHILRSLAAPFFWGVAALTGLLLLNSLPPLIERFGGKGLPASIMIEGVLLFLPALLALTLPMAVLVSVLYGYSQLAAALEMVAMYANGISVWRMARPALVGAAAIAVLNFFVFDQLVPRSNIRFSDLQTAVMNKTPTLALQQQVLNTLPPSGYVLRAASIDPLTGAMRGVTIFDLAGTGSRRLIIADSGSMAKSSDGKDLILTLHTGEIYEFTRNEPEKLQQTSFVHNRVVVRNVQNELQVSKSARVNLGEREKSSCELLDGITDQKWSVASFTRESESYTRRDLRAMTGLPPVLPPSVQTKPRFAPHCGVYRRFEHWFRGVMLPQQLGAQVPQQPVAPPPAPPVPQNPPVVQPGAQQFQPGGRQFLVNPGGIQGADPLTAFGAVNFVDLQLNDAKETMRKYQVEYHQKFAVPLSSFCFVLIGMALALKYPGSGIGLVIGGSLVIFLGFYIMLQGGKNIAAAGHLNPAVALYAPLILFTAVGLLAVNAANREMGTARSAGVFSTIAGFFRRSSRD